MIMTEIFNTLIDRLKEIILIFYKEIRKFKSRQ